VSDELALLLILAGLHLMESCQIVAHGTVIFRSTVWGRHTAERASALLRVSRGRFIFLNPLDPRAHAQTTGLPHILPVAEGVLDVAPEEDNALRRRPCVPWSAIGPVRAAESSVVCAGLGTLDCGSARAARVWARVLNTLRTARPERRALLATRWLHARFAPAHARRREERVQRACRPVEFLSLAGFLLLIAGAFVVTQRTSEVILLGFLGSGVVSGLAIAAAFWRAHARLERRDWSGRLGRTLMIAACFPIAFRARASLGRDTLALVHPIAAAAALLPPDRAQPMLAAALRRWLHRSASPEEGSADHARLAAAARDVAERIQEAARSLAIDAAALTAPPPLDDPSIRTWCPRCHATYVHTAGTCADCPDVPLLAVQH